MAIGIGGKLGGHVVEKVPDCFLASFDHLCFFDAIFQDTSHFGIAGHVPAIRPSVSAHFLRSRAVSCLHHRSYHALGCLGFDPDVREDRFASLCVFHRHERLVRLVQSVGLSTVVFVAASALPSVLPPFPNRVEPESNPG